jgi:hypothetical protein
VPRSRRFAVVSRPELTDTRVVVVLLRDGHLQHPYANCVPNVERWVDRMRDVACERFVGAFVTDLRQPGIKPKADPLRGPTALT